MTRRGLAALAFLLAAPALAQSAQSVQGVVVEPPRPTSRDLIRLTVVGTQYPECPVVIEGGAKDPAGSSIGISARFPECSTPLSPQEVFQKTIELDHLLEPGDYLVYVVVDGLPHPSLFEVFDVHAADVQLSLGEDDRFLALVEWKNHRDGSQGAGYADRLAEDSGAFWFFSPDNLEATIKILDGRPINGHWWVFIASMTDLEMKVTIYENRDGCFDLPVFPPACPSETYHQDAGRNRNFVDVNAFGEEP